VHRTRTTSFLDESLTIETPRKSKLASNYGTGMRDVFVGVLFAIALFMFSYRGYERRDEVAGKLACCFAIGVALFPEPSKVPWVPRVHYAFAAALFLTFSYFSLCLFTKTHEDRQPTERKRWRNRVYVACGVAMLAFIGLIGLYALLWQKTRVAQINPVFWLESLTLWAFGISWGVKGEAILKDN
jgi:hypothetical protein